MNKVSHKLTYILYINSITPIIPGPTLLKYHRLWIINYFCYYVLLEQVPVLEIFKKNRGKRIRESLYLSYSEIRKQTFDSATAFNINQHAFSIDLPAIAILVGAWGKKDGHFGRIISPLCWANSYPSTYTSVSKRINTAANYLRILPRHTNSVALLSIRGLPVLVQSIVQIRHTSAF